MTTLRFGILALVCLVVPVAADAADIVLDGEVSCRSIGGAWSGGTCTVDRLVVSAGTRLFVTAVGLSADKVIVDGTLDIRGGSFQVTRSLVNRGQLTTYSFVSLTGPMWNRGTWENGGQFFSDSTVVNEWNLFNQGSVESATFINEGGVLNYTGWIRNAGGTLVNRGFILNAGYLDNPAGAVLENHGAIETYDGTFFNTGTALGLCGSAWVFQAFGTSPGTPVGNPVEYLPCSPTRAIHRLSKVVLTLGRQRVLARADTMVLVSLLVKARVVLNRGDEAGAVALLQRFNAEVRGRVGATGWYGLGYSLILRANAAMELIEPD